MLSSLQKRPKRNCSIRHWTHPLECNKVRSASAQCASCTIIFIFEPIILLICGAIASTLIAVSAILEPLSVNRKLSYSILFYTTFNLFYETKTIRDYMTTEPDRLAEILALRCRDWIPVNWAEIFPCNRGRWASPVSRTGDFWPFYSTFQPNNLASFA